MFTRGGEVHQSDAPAGDRMIRDTITVRIQFAIEHDAGDDIACGIERRSAGGIPVWSAQSVNGDELALRGVSCDETIRAGAVEVGRRVAMVGPFAQWIEVGQATHLARNGDLTAWVDTDRVGSIPGARRTADLA